MPKISIAMPDHKFIFIPNDFVYIAKFEAVYKPYIVNSIPNTVNINPIGIFISNIFLVFSFEFLVLSCFYQNSIVNTVAIASTKMANVVERLYQTTFSSFNFGVNE